MSSNEIQKRLADRKRKYDIELEFSMRLLEVLRFIGE